MGDTEMEVEDQRVTITVWGRARYTKGATHQGPATREAHDLMEFLATHTLQFLPHWHAAQSEGSRKHYLQISLYLNTGVLKIPLYKDPEDKIIQMCELNSIEVCQGNCIL